MTVKTADNKIVQNDLLSRLAETLAPKAKELGLLFAAYNHQGIIYGPVSPDGFLDLVYNRHQQKISAKRQELVDTVLKTNKPVQYKNRLGCCVIAIPVFDRRRLIGVIILEYPPIELSLSDSIKHLCYIAELDRIVMQDYAKRACRYQQTDMLHIQKIFTDLMLEQIYNFEAHNAVVSLSSNLANTYEELALLYRVSGSMTVSMEPADFLEDLASQIHDVMGVDLTAAVITDEFHALDDDSIIQSGDCKLSLAEINQLIEDYIKPAIADSSKTLIKNNFPKLYPQSRNQFSIPINSLIATPLLSNGASAGYLISINKQEAEFDSADIKLIRSVADQTSVFLTNHKMYAELQDLLMGVLYSLTESIDAKDPYTCGHSRRVATISRKLAKDIGLPAKQVQQIYLSGLLHDVGKIGIPEAILCKNGKLTDDEYANMKRHPAIGAKILRRIRHLQPIIAGVVCHHERLDGRGYPNQLKGDEIPIEGRILCIADSWDAMTSHRTYRSALDYERAKSELIRCKGTQFDPELVDVFLSWDIEKFMEELHSFNSSDLYLSKQDF